MSYDTLKLEAGKQRIDVVDITVEGCANVYGVSPCNATGDENLQTYSEAIHSSDISYIFVTSAAAVPGSYPTGATTASYLESTSAIPFLKGATVNVADAPIGLPFRIFLSVLADTVTEVTLSKDGNIAVFNISAGTITSTVGTPNATIVSDGGSWWKIGIEVSASTGTTYGISIPNATGLGNGFYITKAHVTTIVGNDTYIKTTSASRPKTGEDKCFNSWATCQDTANYLAEDKVISFCTPVSIVPDGCIPFLDSVKGDSGQLDPENSLGKRGQITVNVMDAPHDDTNIDPYVDERSYSALERGTFWPRFRARFPFYQGRKLEWYQGYYPFTRANAKKRTYIIEDLRGWGRSGKITIVAKDPLKLADDKRAQWPQASTGLLTSSLSAVATPTTLDITTGTATEYDLQDYETTGVVLIGSEIIPYTGTTPITDGVRLTGVGTRGIVGDYETPKSAHAAGDAVQKCAYFEAMKVPKVIQVLLERGGSVPAAYIDYTTWETEYDTWLAGFTVTRLICKPEGVTSIIKELIPQSNTWALWFDNEAEEIRYQVVRPLDYNELIDTFSDDDNIIGGSLAAQDDDSRLMNQILVQYGQIDPTKDAKDGTNYREGFVAIDVGSQSAREHNQTFNNQINGRWHGTGNRAELIVIADKLLQARSSVPIRVEFNVDRKDDAAKTGQFLRLETAAITDQFGVETSTIIRVIQQDAGDDVVKYVARQELLAAGFARIAPDTYAAGYSYLSATDEEKQRYAFIANSTTGLLGGTDPGTKLL